MKLTLKEALDLCIEHWAWIAEHPGARKEDWPELERGFLGYTYRGRRIPHACFLCTWRDENKLSCDSCPIVPCYLGGTYRSWLSALDRLESGQPEAKAFLEHLKKIRRI
jgi:hypothetical protein